MLPRRNTAAVARQQLRCGPGTNWKFALLEEREHQRNQPHGDVRSAPRDGEIRVTQDGHAGPLGISLRRAKILRRRYNCILVLREVVLGACTAFLAVGQCSATTGGTTRQKGRVG